MAIEITEFANVDISVSPVGVSSGNFGILGFLTTNQDTSKTGKSISPAERARKYTSLTSVLGDWETTSEVYRAAVAFYAQTPTPIDFVVHMAYEDAQVASLVGGGTPTPEELVAATWNGSGDLSITIDGVDTAITTLDVSGANPVTYDNIAAIVQIAVDAVVTGATVIHNGYQFVVSGVTTGVSGTITSAASTDCSLDLGLVAHQSSISNGVASETPVAGLAALLVKGTETVGLDINKKWRDGTGLATGLNTSDIADWAEAAKRIFMNTTNDLTTLTSATSHVAAQLKAKALRFSLTTFSRNVGSYVSSSVFGRAASVNFGSTLSTLTLNLKQMPTITAENLTPAEFDWLRSHYASAVVQIGSSVVAYTDSRMASGTWLDTTHGLMWLENRCEVDMFNLMYTTNTKIPITQDGINTTAATLERSLEAAVRNGLAGPGYLADGTYLPDGFIVTAISLEDSPASDKSNRAYKGLSFKMVGAGALHEIDVSGQFSE